MVQAASFSTRKGQITVKAVPQAANGGKPGIFFDPRLGFPVAANLKTDFLPIQ